MDSYIGGILPEYCALCDKPSYSKLSLCDDCLLNLPNNRHACQRCALPLSDLEQVDCGRCLVNPPIWTSAHALWRYEGSAQWLIQHYKFAKAYYLDRSFATLLAAYADRLLQGEFDGVVAVPMHKRRWVNRGFNQAEVLARSVAQQLNIPLLNRGVERIKNTPRFAAGQDKKARRIAIKGAFSIQTHLMSQPVPERILIVDDVKTTGATSEELGNALLQAGAESVSVLVLARTA